MFSINWSKTYRKIFSQVVCNLLSEPELVSIYYFSEMWKRGKLKHLQLSLWKRIISDILLNQLLEKLDLLQTFC